MLGKSPPKVLVQESGQELGQESALPWAQQSERPLAWLLVQQLVPMSAPMSEALTLP